MKFLTIFLLSCAAFAQVHTCNGASFCELPDSPKPQAKTWEELTGHPAHVYTFRMVKRDGHYIYDWDLPALRSNKQVLKSPYFMLSAAAMWGSATYACSHKYTGEEWHSEAPMLAGQTFIGYLADRYIDELYTVGLAGIVAGHYIHASAKGPIQGY